MTNLTQQQQAFLKGEENIFGEKNSDADRAAQIDHLKQERMNTPTKPQWLRKALGLPSNS